MASNSGADDNVSTSTSILLALVQHANRGQRHTFHSHEFFDELERSSGFPKSTLLQTFARLKTRGLITDAAVPQLTSKGRRQIQPYVAVSMPGDRMLMVIFDIPEDFGEQRRQLRNLLKQLGFVQAQRSVWMSTNDHRQTLRESIEDFRLGDWVELYEVSRIG